MLLLHGNQEEPEPLVKELELFVMTFSQRNDKEIHTEFPLHCCVETLWTTEENRRQDCASQNPFDSLSGQSEPPEEDNQVTHPALGNPLSIHNCLFTDSL